MGTLIINLGSGDSASSRNISGAPAMVPIMKAATIRLSLNGSLYLERTIENPKDSIQLSIPTPTGSSFCEVEIDVVPDWEAMSRDYQDSMIEFVTVYTGRSGQVPIATEGDTVVIVPLAIKEMLLTVPHADPAYPYNGTLFLAYQDLSIVPDRSASSKWFSNTSYFRHDRYGRLYLGMTEGSFSYINRYGGENLMNAEVLSSVELPGATAIGGLGIDENTSQFYLTFYDGAWKAGFVDLTQALEFRVPVVFDLSAISLDLLPQGSPIAVDTSGNIYLAVQDGESSRTITKFALSGEPFEGMQAVTPVASRSFADLGYSLADPAIIRIEDMIVRDDKLFVAMSEVDAYNGYQPENFAYSRGRVTALSTENLSVLWDTGWRLDKLPAYPVDPDNQFFYGPRRFVGLVPKKLHILDDGFSWNGVKNGLNYSDQDRLVELDTETGTWTNKVTLADIDLLEVYSSIYVQNC